MKKASIIIDAVLAAAVIALFVLHFTSGKRSNSPEQQPEGRTSFGNIAFIQIDSLVNKYDMFHDLKSELESKAQAIQDDFNKKQMALQRDFSDFNEKYQKGLITRSQVELQQTQLAKRQDELKQFANDKQMEMAEEEQVLIRKVMYALDQYLEKYNADKKFSLILNTSAGTNTILKGDSTLNITNEIVNALNEEYVATRGKK
jgi:outer membrane protein